jgi:hypothetical protein
MLVVMAGRINGLVEVVGEQDQWEATPALQRVDKVERGFLAALREPLPTIPEVAVVATTVLRR